MTLTILNCRISATGVLLLLVFRLAACDCCPTGAGPEPPATRIFDIRREPNPVHVGDSTRFTVVTADSLVDGLAYRWRLLSETYNTAVNHFVWVANVDSGRYEWHVLISRGPSFTSVGRSFTIEVIP